MIERLDARAAGWPGPLRWAYLGVKWTLVALGAYVFVGLYVERIGWGAVWFVGFPVAFGIWDALTSAPPPDGPPPVPAPE